MIALGFLTPAAAASLIGVMSTAIEKVHLKNGPWAGNGGYEYNLVLIAIMVVLADLGPGDFSIDHALGIEVKGPGVAVLALGGGVVGSYLMTRPSGNGGEPPVAEEAPAPEPEAAAV